MRMMSAPASARPMATAWPMPLVPPVIKAVWPSNENKDIIDCVAIVLC
jgi:hypothetical protein